MLGEDYTQVDDEEYFKSLPDNTLFMLINVDLLDKIQSRHADYPDK